MTATILAIHPSVNLITNVSGLKDGMLQTQSDAVAIQTYLTAVRAQPDIVQPYVPDLPKVQADARSLAPAWDKVHSELSGTVSDLIAYGNQWRSYYPKMTQYAHTIYSSSSTQAQVDCARQNLDSGLVNLFGRVVDFEQRATTAGTDLDSFNRSLKDVDVRLGKQLTTLGDKLSLKGGVIDKINLSIDDTNTSIGKDIGVIVTGAISIIGGVIMIVYGAVTTFATAGISTSLILAGVGFVAGGTTALITASIDLNGKIRQLGELEKEKSKAEQLYTGVKTALSQVSALSEQSDAAVIAAQHLAGQWTGLKGNLTTLRQDVKTINPGDRSVMNALQYANTDFQAALATAELIQTNTAGGKISAETGPNGKFPVEKAA